MIMKWKINKTFSTFFTMKNASLMKQALLGLNLIRLAPDQSRQIQRKRLSGQCALLFSSVFRMVSITGTSRSLLQAFFYQENHLFSIQVVDWRLVVLQQACRSVHGEQVMVVNVLMLSSTVEVQPLKNRPLVSPNTRDPTRPWLTSMHAVC